MMRMYIKVGLHKSHFYSRLFRQGPENRGRREQICFIVLLVIDIGQKLLIIKIYCISQYIDLPYET